MKKGLFITFEGPEGCGKTTHSKLLCGHLKKRGYRCVYTREPGGTRLGEAIRKVLLDTKGLDISSAAELLLFEAARAEIVRERIRPSLARGTIVISDRFSDATVAYQGYGSGLDLENIRRIDRLATGGLKPDLTIVLDVETRAGLARAAVKARADRMERKPLPYHARVRRGYLEIARANPGRVKVIRTKRDIESVQLSVRGEVERVLCRFTRPG